MLVEFANSFENAPGAKPPAGVSPNAVPPGGFTPGAVPPPPPPQIGPNGKPIIPGGPAPTVEEWQGGVDRLFAAAFGRAPDQGGRNFWVDKASNDKIGFDKVAENFLESPEGIARFTPDAPKGDFITKMYEGVLGRAPDKGGKNFWLGRLESGELSQAEMLVDFANSKENIKNTETLSTGNPPVADIPNPVIDVLLPEII